MKSLRDYTTTELNTLESELAGFINGFGFNWCKDYINLIVCIKAKMEVDKCDYIDRPNPLPKMDLKLESQRYKDLRLESIQLSKRLADSIRPDVEHALNEKLFNKAYDICYTIPECVARHSLIKLVQDVEDAFFH